jgi:hypothetical protein
MVRPFFLFLLVVVLSAASCREKELHRPSGVIRVAPLSDILAQPSSYFEDLRLLVRVDEKGVSVMSTLCSYDLTPLHIVEQSGKRVFVSDYSSSTYTEFGERLTGPTIHGLHYHKALVEAGVYGGVPDTLFVSLGSESEVSPDWRLSVAQRR